MRLRRYGDPLIRRRLPIIDLFYAGFTVGSDGCWPWKRPDGNGYGKIGKVWAHRYAYELLVGPIPYGLEIDHLCRNRACVNPAHMEPVSKLVNDMRGDSPPALNARKTHCSRGHEFTPENTYVRRATGHRTCRTCYLAWMRAYRRRQAA